MTIEELMKMWAEDSQVDETEPSRELAKIPNLHSKYLKIRANHSLIVKNQTIAYASRKKVLWEYFSGDLNNPEDLSKYKLEPLEKKVIRQDIALYLDSDEELTKITIKRMIHQEMVDCCDSILKELSNRTYQISNIVKWEIFLGGKN
jgi:hypothetical protein